MTTPKREYPCILKASYIWLAIDKNNAIKLDDGYELNKGYVDFDREGFKNITREYLEGKWCYANSNEHLRFIVDLCKNNDVTYHTLMNAGTFTVNFPVAGGSELDMITIPLPPKAESELKEWPQVGDEVITSDGIGILMLPADKTGGYIVEIENNALGYQQYTIDELEKPKTGAEILRDDLIDAMYNSTTAFTYAEHIAKHLIEKYNITKKP